MSRPSLLALSLSVTVMLAAIASSAQAQATQSTEAAQNSDTFTLSPIGYVQFDVRAFPDWDVTPGAGRVSRDTVEVRRTRIGVEGSWRRGAFELSIDPQDGDGIFVKDAYAQVRLSPAFRLRVGQFKVPGTRDYAVSARDLPLLERSALTSSLGVGRDVGARVDGRLGRLSYDAGIFAGDGVGRDDRAGLTVASRVVVNLPHSLEFGGSISGGRTHATDSDPANGTSFFSPSGYRFADGVYVQGTRLRLGADAEWSPGRWTFTAEGLRLRDERSGQGLDLEDLPAAIGTGFNATVVRRLRTRQDASGNLFLNALLRRPLDVSARYDYVSFDDEDGASGTDSVRPRATDIRRRASHGLTLGSTWSVSRWMKVMGNVGAERFTDQRSAPEAGRAGNYLTLAARLQVEWN